jgi:hypothetical protein
MPPIAHRRMAMSRLLEGMSASGDIIVKHDLLDDELGLRRTLRNSHPTNDAHFFSFHRRIKVERDVQRLDMLVSKESRVADGMQDVVIY